MKEYKRFTIKNSDGTYSQPTDLTFEKTVYRLAELEDKIENGTLIELPCKVGNTVYFVNDYRPTPRIEEYVVYGIMLDGREVILHIDFMETINAKNVYFTKAEAEQKLKELQGGKR